VKVWLLATICVLALGLAAICDRPSTNVVDSVVILYNDAGGGSGSIVDANCVLTAKHVAVNSGLTVRTNDGDEYPVVRVVLDPDSDLALVYIEGTFHERPLLFDRTPLRIGDEVTVVGMVLRKEMAGCVMPGRVVNVDRETQIKDYKYTNVDLYDCHAAPGCSGGPVVDRRGRIRAVNVMTFGPLDGGVPVEELDAP